MIYFLYTIFFISCLALIASVLLQPGKTDAGALFTSNISSTAFQPRGAQTILSKITITAATVFMISALMLAMPALTGNISVLQTTSETTETTQPPISDLSNTNSTNADVTQPSNAAVEAPSANTNMSANTNANR